MKKKSRGGHSFSTVEQIRAVVAFHIFLPQYEYHQAEDNAQRLVQIIITSAGSLSSVYSCFSCAARFWQANLLYPPTVSVSSNRFDSVSFHLLTKIMTAFGIFSPIPHCFPSRLRMVRPMLGYSHF